MIVGLFAGHFAFKYLRRRRARRWPTAQAQIDSAGLRYQKGVEMSGAWIAAVEYHYGMPGNPYSGIHRRSFAMKGRAEKWIAAYSVGRAITVRVNPRRPADSVLLETDTA